MEQIEKDRTKERLDKIINEYQELVEQLEDIQWKIIRKQKEIQKICDKLGLAVNAKIEDNDEKK